MQMEGQATPSQGFNQLGKVKEVTREDFNCKCQKEEAPFFLDALAYLDWI